MYVAAGYNVVMQQSQTCNMVRLSCHLSDKQIIH